MTEQAVSSPLSTGGAGTFFEQHVGVYWLAQLLVRAIPPILIDSNVIEVSFQTERLGWRTDDFLVTCERAGEMRGRLAGQVKRTFTVSASNEECQKTIRDFWADFKSQERFSVDHDRFALVVQRGTDVLLRDFAGLLECAHAARNAGDFQRRLDTPGLISKKAVHYFQELCSIVGELEQRAVSSADLWPFLRVLHVLSLDLDTSTRQSEAQIRSLLAHTASDRNSSAIAQSTWHSLLELASTAMRQACSLRLADLPEAIRQQHGAIGSAEERMLRALREHTAPILRKIRATIGTLHLERAALVQNVLDELESSQVVIISGAAGSGKSAIGKNVAAQLARYHFVFGFRVEEFAQPHIDATLHAAQIPGNAETLVAILSAQTRKLVLIESVERLLERSTRDAFSDLMAQVAADPDMRLVLTCRDYSTELVRASFLRSTGLSHQVVTVPPLNDAELAEIVRAIPTLAIPLGNERLRTILRNPYFLDKALSMSWSTDRPVPESEREFRAMFWMDTVRGAIPALARRREATLQQVAIRRARALAEYVAIVDLDFEAIESLRQDSLIVSPDNNPGIIATAHDVLEDWAILQWLGELHQAHMVSLQELSEAIGPYPAIRRSYRKWISELLEREPAAADRLFAAATGDSGATQQFRDDTLVALLRAPLAPQLLVRHQPLLLANGGIELKRVVHLLRVACVTTPDWRGGAGGYGSLFNVPDGSAWRAVLKLVHDSQQELAAIDSSLLLALIEDAVRGVSIQNPIPPGRDWIAGIAYNLLPRLRGYRSDDSRERLLKVIARIPAADPQRFEAVLRGTGVDEKSGDKGSDRIAEEFQDLLLTGLEGTYVARDLPDLLAAVAADYLLVTEEELRRERYGGFSIDVHVHFGLREETRSDFFPASALRGPWFALLQHHATVGLELYFKVFNYSIDWYVHPRVPDHLEPAIEVDLTFADDSVHKQWVNMRLWCAYRGTQVSPYALQSMLMALEKWLLEIAQVFPEHLDGLLLRILRGTENASLSAVVASVAIAYPRSAGETLLVLLSAPELIHLDRGRMASEPHAAGLNRMFPEMRADNQVYRRERDISNGLPHRKHDLEWAISNLQLGPLAERAYVLLDRHIAALPTGVERDQSQLVWQLSIQRMDLRQYTVVETEEVPPGVTEEVAAGNYVLLQPNITDAEVRAMVEQSAATQSAMNQSLGLWMWGVKAFKGEATPEEKVSWRARLTQARTRDREAEDDMGGRSGPGVVAAVCIRDHWSEMSDEERGWCTEVACSEVMRTADQWDRMERFQRYDMSADRPCASVLPQLLIRTDSGPRHVEVRTALAAAITHPIDEVGWHAAWGVNAEVWAADSGLALRCANAVAAEALLVEQGWARRNGRRRWQPGETEAISVGAAREVRRRFWQPDGIADDAHARLGFESKTAAGAMGRVLTILAFVPAEPASVAGFERASRALVNAWDSDRRGGEGRNFEAEKVLEIRIEEFVMRTTPQDALRVLQPILDALDRHDREVHSVIQGLTGQQDRNPNTAHYWYLWGLFAERIKRAGWNEWLDRDCDHPTGSHVLAAIFLTLYWKEGVRHWRSLEGHAHHVDELFEALPPSWIVLDDYLRFLYHIGERSLPDAFVRIARVMQRGNARGMLVKSNSVFILEVLLQRHVYGRPLELKQNPDTRHAVLYLLDVLVECGSSAAFQMRDDFVTPAA